MRLVAEAQTGAKLEGNTRDFHFYPFSVHGYFEWRNIVVAMALARKGDTIIEIGANVGTETVSFSDVVGPSGTVHAFEPFPTNVVVLRRAAELNRDRTIVVHPLAISNRDGTMEFAVPPAHSSGVGHLVHDGHVSADTLTVDCTTLDALASRVGEAKLIFIDAEGEEYNIVEGAQGYLCRYHPHMVVEASPRLLARAGSSLDELHDLLRDHGYDVYEISRFGLVPARPSAQHRSVNWVCFSGDAEMHAKVVRDFIRRGAFLPCLLRLNPLGDVCKNGAMDGRLTAGVSE